ncbi:MAG TPA: FAD binding domain-containing protein [Xanthobacteraceae bacterium]|nr:FAD binding domain-containing protein [Xanthobacteraceae bacterium]
MKPVRFDYERPTDLAAAAAAGRRDDVAVKFLAGGQSLGPMLNLRLAEPDLVVDITGIAELKRVEEKPDSVVLGSCITHADIEDGRVPDVTNGALRKVASGIAYRAVRNRGTIGGSLAHADPAADWIAALSAAGASVIVHDGRGARRVPVEDFIVGVFETVLAAGELVTGVEIPRRSRAARWGYYKVCRKTGEFAHAIGVFVHDPERSFCRAVVGAAGARPIVLADADKLFNGRIGSPDVLNIALVRDAMSANGMADPIDQKIHVAALRRAVAEAQAS